MHSSPFDNFICKKADTKREIELRKLDLDRTNNKRVMNVRNIEITVSMQCVKENVRQNYALITSLWRKVEFV